MDVDNQIDEINLRIEKAIANKDQEELRRWLQRLGELEMARNKPVSDAELGALGS